MGRTSIAVAVALTVAGCKEERRSPMAEAAAACAHDAEVSCARPIFTVHDLRASQRYYRDALGFKVDWEHGKPPSFGSVSRGHGVFFLCQGCLGPSGAWAMTFVPDVDKLHKEFVRRKAKIRMPPTDMPWGLREMHVIDLDGNVIRFGCGSD